MERIEPYLLSMGVSGRLAVSVEGLVASVAVVLTESVVLTET